MAKPIILTDNNRFCANKKDGDTEPEAVFVNTYNTSKELLLLKEKFSSVHISELCNEHSSLLVFPNDIQGKEDDPVLFDAIPIYDDSEKTSHYRFKTDNLMGFVGVTDEKGKSQYLRITSRFAVKKNIDNKKDKDGVNDFFLQYLLQKVFHFNLFKNIDFTKDPKVQAFDWLMMMFPHFLKKAYAQGLFRAYKTFKHNDANVRGVIDTPRHLRKNVPFQGRIAYNTREYTRDNPLMQLVRHTIECIERHKTGKDILRTDTETREAVDVIRQYTLYVPNDLQQVIAQNTRPVSHPFYTAYADLQNICLKILRHERIGYGNSKDTVYGMIFDGAWLWEEYLNTILRTMGYSHPQNKAGIGAISLFSEESPISHNLYPDFYNPSQKIVLDAKYKRFDERLNAGSWDSGVREDVFQLVTYMHILGYKTGCFAYPCKENKEAVPYPLSIEGERIVTIPFCVPDSSVYNWKSYCDEMKKREESFKEKCQCSPSN